VSWRLVFTKQAKKDAKKIAQSGLKPQTSHLLDLLIEDPYRNPPLLFEFTEQLGDQSTERARLYKNPTHRRLKDEYLIKKPKRKLSAAEKAEKRRRRKEYMTIFINGKQKRVKRPLTIDGLEVDDFIRQNADPIWLHQNEMWEYMTETDFMDHSQENDDPATPPEVGKGFETPF